MFRATGIGKWDAHLELEYIGVVEALLYNFDFDDFYGFKYRPLKMEHQIFLKDHVIPWLANDRGNIWMRGSASRIGTAGWNMELSRNRVITVARFLGANGISADQIETDAIGNTRTMNHALDDERDRGVLLWVYPKVTYHPLPKPHIPQKKYVSTRFTIALLTSVSGAIMLEASKFLKGKVGAGIAVDTMFFVVWDTTNNFSCMYLYIGIGGSLGLTVPYSPPVSGTTHGPWNDFTTEKPIHVFDFKGPARFRTAGALKWSINRFEITTPPGVDDVDIFIDTGTTLGLGASETRGDFIRLEGPSPFRGP